MMEFGFYNMDCMDGMREFPDQYFDLAIVDPPYGINANKFGNGNYAGGRGDSAARKTERKRRLNQGAGKLKNRVLNRSDCDWDVKPPGAEYFKELFRVSKNQIIWGVITLIYLRHAGLSFGIRCSHGRIFHKWK